MSDTKIEIEKLFESLKNYYGIDFNLESQEHYKIRDDMNNIQGTFGMIDELLDKLEEEE